MYRPEDTKAPRYPVFEKLNGRIIPWISGKGALVIIAAFIIAASFIHLTAAWTRTVEVETTDAERAEALSHLSQVRDVAVYDEAEAEVGRLSDGQGAPREDLTEEERERYYELISERAIAMRSIAAVISTDLAEMRREAESLGITARTTDEELAAFVPATKTAERRVVGAPVAVLVAGAIVLAAAALMVEPREGMNLYRLLREERAFKAKQHEYLYARRAGSFDATLEGRNLS